jgi:hypothetical protein
VKELLVRASSSVEFISFQIIQQVIVVVLAVFSGFFIFDKINKVNSNFTARKSKNKIENLR